MTNRVRPLSHGHIGSMKSYINTWITLLILTVITVAVSYIDMGGILNILFALGIAFIKATVVVVYFMHLTHDESITSFYGILFPLVVLMILIAMALIDIFFRIIPLISAI